jgi:hypothetical protein
MHHEPSFHCRPDCANGRRRPISFLRETTLSKGRSSMRAPCPAGKERTALPRRLPR